MTRKVIDWEALEIQYRAGIRSLKDIGREFGVSDAAIVKRAKRDGWTRDLRAKIHARAEAKVSAAVVSAEVSAQTRLNERETIEKVSDEIVSVRLAHRNDIRRSRALTNKLLDELECLTDNRELFEQLGELMHSPDDKGMDKLSDLYRKVVELPNRTKVMKELAETLRVLVALERQAYNLDEQQHEEPYEERLRRVLGGE